MLRQLARSVRHAPGLEQMEPLWRALRTPYYALARRRGGVVMRLGGYPIRVPMEFAQVGWDDYERASMRAFTKWVTQHPAGVVIDVGCAVGLYSHVALSLSPEARVIAIDADLASLAATLRLTGNRAGDRLALVAGFIGERASTTQPMGEAWATTRDRLAAGEGQGEPTYRCLGSTDAIPTYTLDGLLAGYIKSDATPLLVKIDIEGAEVLALRGAHQLLSRRHVTWLMSVHPVHLQRDFRQSPIDVSNILSAYGYQARYLAVDHEEHWLYELGERVMTHNPAG